MYLLHASVLKWSTRADCKSADLRLRWFESSPAHNEVGLQDKHRISAGFLCAF